MKFIVLIEKDEDGLYVAEVPDLRGCYTQGKTLEEVLKNIKEVIELCLESGREIGRGLLRKILRDAEISRFSKHLICNLKWLQK